MTTHKPSTDLTSFFCSCSFAIIVPRLGGLTAAISFYLIILPKEAQGEAKLLGDQRVWEELCIVFPTSCQWEGPSPTHIISKVIYVDSNV